MNENQHNLYDAIVRDPKRFISDEQWRNGLPREVYCAVIERLRSSNVPAKIFNAFMEQE